MGLFGSANKVNLNPMVLLVIDGFGIAPPSNGNAITIAKTPNWDRYVASYPYGQVIAAGESVGLPANEAGNSEVGHLTIGAGRAIKQSLPRIDESIKDGTFMDNRAFVDAIGHVKKNNSKLHIMGLTSGGSVHSSMSHLWGLIDFCRKYEMKEVLFHLFTDGRDAAPTEGIKAIGKTHERLKSTGVGRIATLMGRYYAMDRDGKWDRTKLAYDCLVLGRGKVGRDPVESLQASYNTGKTDEFVEPTIIKSGPNQVTTISDNDAVIFFNFRVDRPRQLTMSFVFPDFESLKTVDFGYIPYEKGRKDREQTTKGKTFTRERVAKNLYFVTMTEYQKKFPVSAIAFPTFQVVDSLPEVIAKKSFKQLHLAESEKERMVAYYFDGLTDVKFAGEDTIIVPSPRVATYDKKPEMNVHGIVKKFKKELAKGKYHFFVMNFANPDMVAHTGNLKATIKGLEEVDKAMGQLVEAILAVNGTVLITADHGNAEELLSFPTGSFYITTEAGSINTEHSGNPVPVCIINKSYRPVRLNQGTLADVAPTILAIMKIDKPAAMTGNSLIKI